MSRNMLSVLQHWLDAGWIRAVDLQFAKQLVKLTPISDQKSADSALLLLALLSHQVGRGHVCIDLAGLLSEPNSQLAIPPPEKRYPQSKLAAKEAAEANLPASLLSELNPDAAEQLLLRTELASDGTKVTPLVIDSQRLYMRRYWLYEQQVTTAIQSRLTRREGLNDKASERSQAMQQTLNHLFNATDAVDYQRAACALAARSRFGLITGGPGTGKTTTVIKLLALLQAQAKTDSARTEQAYRIELAAPTGKAAARLNESIRSAVDAIEPQLQACGLTKADLPSRVRTLHRLLGSQRFSREFRHNSDNPLPIDVLVIDEASMVDLSMLAAVVGALPTDAQLILLGDQDQLASVEAGSILGELCSRSRDGHYLPTTVDWLRQVAGIKLPAALTDEQGQALDQSVAMLRHSYRFDAASGIGQLATAINTDQSLNEILNASIAGDYADIHFVSPEKTEATERSEALLRLTEQQACLNTAPSDAAKVSYAGYLKRLSELRLTAETTYEARNVAAAELLQAYSRFQLLTPVRQGDFGVTELNKRIEQKLHALKLIDNSNEWYHGRPVMISANDYNVGLMNGDVGICLVIGDRPLVAFMPAETNEQMRWIPPSRLPAHETVFAMTVHKSQGSEFEHCALLLPPQDSPVLTRELVYTAITRARSFFTLISERPESLLTIAQRRTERASGLGAALFGAVEGSEEISPVRANEARDGDQTDAPKPNPDEQLDLF